MDGVNVVAASTDTHGTERTGVRSLDDAVNVFAFGCRLDRGLVYFSTHDCLPNCRVLVVGRGAGRWDETTLRMINSCLDLHKSGWIDLKHNSKPAPKSG